MSESVDLNQPLYYRGVKIRNLQFDSPSGRYGFPCMGDVRGGPCVLTNEPPKPATPIADDFMAFFECGIWSTNSKEKIILCLRDRIKALEIKAGEK